jgi:hypothetical protein
MVNGSKIDLLMCMHQWPEPLQGKQFFFQLSDNIGFQCWH